MRIWGAVAAFWLLAGCHPVATSGGKPKADGPVASNNKMKPNGPWDSFTRRSAFGSDANSVWGSWGATAGMACSASLGGIIPKSTVVSGPTAVSKCPNGEDVLDVVHW